MIGDEFLLTEHTKALRATLKDLLPPMIGAAVFLFIEDDAGGATVTFLTNRDRMAAADIVEEWLDHSIYIGHPLAEELQRLRNKLRETLTEGRSHDS